MRKYYKYLLLLFAFFFINSSFICAANFKCSISGYEVEYNSSGNIVAVYKNGKKDTTFNGNNVEYKSQISPKSVDECPSNSRIEANIVGPVDGKFTFSVQSSVATASKATSCAEFVNETECNLGVSETGKFGCAWNEKYKFCSPTGLAYLSCGSGSSDAHDIPVFLPRITSYAIVILKTATPIILIIMSMIQLIKAIASQNEDEMKKARSALVKKLIAAALIFFVTTIVQFVIKQVADDDEAGSMNDCLSCFVNNDCNGSTYYTDGYGKCYYISNKYTAVDCNTDIGVKERGLVEESKENNN